MKSAKAVSQKRAVPHSTELLEIRRCAYCSGTFMVKADSVQIYCNPAREKRLVYERKKALVFALTGLYWRRQCRAMDMFAVAERCVHADPDGVMQAFMALGYTYDPKAQRWLWKGRKLPQEWNGRLL